MYINRGFFSPDFYSSFALLLTLSYAFKIDIFALYWSSAFKNKVLIHDFKTKVGAAG